MNEPAIILGSMLVCMPLAAVWTYIDSKRLSDALGFGIPFGGLCGLFVAGLVCLARDAGWLVFQ